MRKTREEKAITLIALIITIVVLLILAVIAINAVTGDGIIQHATNAKTEYEEGKVKEESILDSYLGKLDVSVLPRKNMEDAKKEEVLLETTKVIDNYGNIVIVPKGFKITEDADNVSEGIVIEDVSSGTEYTKGSQFVWIPVGTVYMNEARTTSKKIELNRYSFSLDNGVATPKGEEIVDNCQELAISTYGNATAKDINDFKSSVSNYGGYYIGRYEARDAEATSERTIETVDTNKVACVKNKYVYNYISEFQASSLCQNMYVSTNFTSDLINSYAWDTAIVFIQECSSDNTAYALQTPVSANFSNIGTTEDVVCNIYDMASNCCELTTEYGTMEEKPEYNCTIRGGFVGTKGTRNWTCYRAFGTAAGEGTMSHCSFRPIIYL